MSGKSEDLESEGGGAKILDTCNLLGENVIIQFNTYIVSSVNI